MESIEADYETLRGVLPKNDYHSIDNDVLGKLLVKLDPEELRHMSGDVFGRIYEYFLTQFAGQGAHDGGEFFTPVSLVSFIANVLEPERGIVLDPACGSGGMFVQSARVVERRNGRPSDTLTFYGMEKNDVTIRLAKMNLAVHGLEGDIRQAITYYSDPHELVGKCDFVMANPPFNVDDIDAARVKADPRLPFGLPGENKEGRVPNGNYVWISYFYSYLNKTGRAGFVMAAGAESAGRDEALVRRKLVETGDVEAMVSIRSNFFYTRTVPCVLWFIDRGKADRRSHVLMIDARNVFRKVTRKICDFSPEQERNLVAIVWLYRGETERFRALLADYRAQSAAVDLSPVAAFWEGMDAKREDTVEAIESAARARIAALGAKEAQGADAKGRRESAKAVKAVEEASAAAVEALKRKEYFLDAARWLEERFPDGVYRDVEGLVKAVSLEEIAANDWSLTPGRYVGVAETDDGDEDFAEKFAALHEELRQLDAEAAKLAKNIDENFGELMG
jgi:type I restriction enzyme M protein